MTVPFHQFIADNRRAIVDRFVVAVTSLAPEAATRSVIVDHIPQFLDGLVQALAGLTHLGSRTSLPTTRDAARDHGSQRLEHDFSLDAVIREYGILRHVILQAAGEAQLAISAEAFDIFAQALHSAVVTAVSQFTEQRQREVAIERERLRTSLAILPVGVFIIDASGKAVEINEAARQMWGRLP